ncbi:hypothetical protein ACFLWA_11950 [Chloroflexota bacterium]
MKRACAVLICVLAHLVLLACGPTVAPTGVASPFPPSLSAGTPEPTSMPAACGGRIAFIGRTADEKDIFVINADGIGLANVTNGDGPEDSPSWSPDGSRIAFSRHVGNSDIYTIRPDGTGLLRLTDMSSGEYSPGWSPDGQRVIFGSTSGYQSEILVVSAEGGEAIALTDSSAHKPDLAWSPHGSHIGFTQLDNLNQGDIFVTEAPDEAEIAPSDAVNLTRHQANDCCLDWAPDGQRLLFLSSRGGTSAEPVMAGSARHPQTSLLLVRTDMGGDPSAASDAVRPLTTVVPEQPRDIYAVNRDGSELVKLTNGVGREKHATWSPDGKSIAFVSDREGNDDIYVLIIGDSPEAGGSEMYRLTDSPEDEWHPIWSPDGSCLAFVSYHDGEAAIHAMSADGSSRTKLADSVVWSSGPSWSP